MPTPLEILLDPVSLIVFAVFGGLMLWEAVFPGRPLPRIRGWRLRGLAAFAAFFYLSTYLPLIWDGVLARFRLIDLTGLATAAQVAIGLLVYELGAYLWHRSMHRFTVLWRGVHQMHHSAERLDTTGAFYFSPLDMVGWTALGSLALVVVVGVGAEAATILVLAITFLGIFQHANIRTPRWLGYLIQRPESHTVHHGRGVHGYNYADLPVFDMIFGTFRNPAGYEMETGFYEGASARVLDMVLFRDVSEPGTARARDSAPAFG